MNGYACEQVRELAPELALGVLGGAERAEALIHLGHCARCQAYVAELTEAADVLPLAAPEQEPPPGFEARVLAELDAGRRTHRRRWIASVAVAAAAAAILSITIVRVVEADAPTASPSVRVSAEPAPAVMQARMVSDASGEPVGWAYVSGGRAVALTVNYGLEDGDYDIEVRPTGGEPVVIGDMNHTGGRDSWAGTSPVQIGPQSVIALVQQLSKTTVCHGEVDVVRAGGDDPVPSPGRS